MTLLEAIKDYVEVDGERVECFVAGIEDKLVGCVERFGATDYRPLYNTESIHYLSSLMEEVKGKPCCFVTFLFGTFEEKSESIAKLNPDALFANGLEDALVGYVEGYEEDLIALYDTDKCIDKLAKEFSENLDNDEDYDPHSSAQEYFDYNTLGSWVGKGTPAFALISRFEE